jgi:hypothetical protein
MIDRYGSRDWGHVEYENKVADRGIVSILLNVWHHVVVHVSTRLGHHLESNTPHAFP